MQGLQAGAFQTASQAAVLANATVATADAVQVLLTQGPDAFFSQVSSWQAVEVPQPGRAPQRSGARPFRVPIA